MSLLGDIGGAVGGAFGGLPGAIVGGGGIGIGGGGVGGAAMDILTGGATSNTQAAMNINQENIDFAQKQMDFQQTNSNTAYQRAVADMRAAGLNPMLAYSQGGASVPQGTTPQLQNPEPGNVAAGLVNSAKSIITGAPEFANKVASTENTKADTGLTNEKTTQVQADVQNTNQDTANKAVTHQILHHQKKKAQADAKSATMDTQLQSQRFGWDKNMQKYDSVAERAGPVIKGAVEATGVGALLKRIFGASQTTSKPTKSDMNNQYWQRQRGKLQ